MVATKKFLDFSYSDFERINLEIKSQRMQRITDEEAQKFRITFLTQHEDIATVTLCFSDLEGRFHMLDYDKRFFLKSYDALSFDGSSVRGFSLQKESDLRLKVDWAACYVPPADVFGEGKVLFFAEVCARDGAAYSADMRAQLRSFLQDRYASDGIELYAANEVEGFLFAGVDAEKLYHEYGAFSFAASGGYYHGLPLDPLRQFIDKATRVLRALGFEPEKDHPEVAPAQFELNYSYTEMLLGADQVQLYKIVCRQIAASMGMTASFLPKPVIGINGSGMHTNISINKQGKNLFYDVQGEDGLSELGWSFVDGILARAHDLCLVLNPSVNAYRRLDPHYEAPNQVMVSANNRGAMVRIPWGNQHSARIEVRSVGPDANPYMVMYTIAQAGFERVDQTFDRKNQNSILPDNLCDAIAYFEQSLFMQKIMGSTTHNRFVILKQAQADRCPKLLGKLIKSCEIQYHHEVTNQLLWSIF